MTNEELDKLGEVIFEAFRELTARRGKAGVMTTPWPLMPKEDKAPSIYIAKKVDEYYKSKKSE